jgi:hypothetical protein
MNDATAVNFTPHYFEERKSRIELSNKREHPALSLHKTVHAQLSTTMLHQWANLLSGSPLAGFSSRH